MKTEEIKLKWQKHNRDNGMSWNEVAELVNELSGFYRHKHDKPAVSEDRDAAGRTESERIAWTEGYSAAVQQSVHPQSDAQQRYVELIHECRLQLEYLNEKFGETGTTNSVLSRIAAGLKEGGE